MGDVMLFAATEGVTMSSVLGDVTSILSSAMGWVGTISSTIAGNPILLLGVVLPFVGFGAGMFRRLLHM